MSEANYTLDEWEKMCAARVLVTHRPMEVTEVDGEFSYHWTFWRSDFEESGSFAFMRMTEKFCGQDVMRVTAVFTPSGEAELEIWKKN